jgi:hypothetical protein
MAGILGTFRIGCARIGQIVIANTSLDAIRPKLFHHRTEFAREEEHVHGTHIDPYYPAAGQQSRAGAGDLRDNRQEQMGRQYWTGRMPQLPYPSIFLA